MRAGVETFYDDVFKGNALSGVEWIPFERAKKLVERPHPVGRHDFASQRIACRMKTDGQVDPESFLGQFGQTGYMSHRRQGDFAARKVKCLRCEQNFYRPDDVIVVVQRLAHSHEDEIGNPPWFGHFLCHHDLGDDFLGRQVSHESKRCRPAKRTSEFASHL